MPPITVVIADHRQARRAACLRLLAPIKGIRVVGQARSGLGAIAATKLKPRILLLDLTLARGMGTSLVPLIRQRSPRTKVILLAVCMSEALIIEALFHGVPGYLDEKSLCTFLEKAVRVVDAGEAWVPRWMVAEVAAWLRARSEHHPEASIRSPALPARRFLRGGLGRGAKPTSEFLSA
jgi:DNA-binding NarL/FixJ family response regulator